MPYVRRNWQNAPSSATPLNAAALNNIEDGVEEAVEAVTGRLSEATLESTFVAGQAVSTDDTNDLPAPTGVGLEFVITAEGLDDIRFDGVSL